MAGYYIFASLFFLAFDLIFGHTAVTSAYDPLEASSLVILAGGAYYHLHFFAALILLVAIVPFRNGGLRAPQLLALITILSLARACVEAWLGDALNAQPIPAGYLLSLHGLKTAELVPFALLGRDFSGNLGFVRRWRKLLLFALAILIDPRLRRRSIDRTRREPTPRRGGGLARGQLPLLGASDHAVLRAAGSDERRRGRTTAEHGPLP